MIINNYKKSVLSGAVLLGGLLFTNVASADTNYTIKSGDTLNAISERFGTDADTLAKLNNVENKNLIYAGETLKISIDGDSAPVVTPVQPTTPQAPVAPAPAPVAPKAQPTAPATPVVPKASSAKEVIAQRESGGSYTARNGRYVGRYQLTDAYLNGDYSPANQERVADNYVANRYGSWEGALAFWNANGWY